jgi:hypothetical protein
VFLDSIVGLAFLHFLHETRFQADGDAVHFARDLVVAIDEAYAFGFRSAFEDLVAAAEFQVLDCRGRPSRHGHQSALRPPLRVPIHGRR